MLPRRPDRMCTVQFIGSMRGVRGEGKFVNGFHFFCGCSNRGVRIAIVANDFARLARICQKLLVQALGGFCGVRAFVPVDFAALCGLAWRPRNSRRATTTPPAVNAPSPTGSIAKTSCTPGTALAFVASNDLQPSAKNRASRNHGVVHTRRDANRCQISRCQSTFSARFDSDACRGRQS